MKFKPAPTFNPLVPPTPISPEDLEWFTRKVEGADFRFAKSMPTIPHFYTNKHKDWADPEDYERAGLLILCHGQPESLWRFPVRRYLYAGAWRYWLMTTDIRESYIMNRCDPLHPRYRGAIKPAVETY